MKKSIFILTLFAYAFIQAYADNAVIDDLQAGSSVNVTPAQFLRGEVSGVHVSGTDGSITGALNTLIRGISSLHSDSEPLWIVDGAYLTSSIGQNRNAFWQSS